MWDQNILDIVQQIKEDPENAAYTRAGVDPLFSAPENARILVVGQAPGEKAVKNKQYWRDQSGDRLRDWMGVDEDTFYNTDLLAVVPMDFYYPGRGKSGDLPPRKGFAPKWHPLILSRLPHLQLTLLIGQYAMGYYLKGRIKGNVTQTVKAYQEYGPAYFPLVHPSPRNQIWLKKNPWFLEETVPDLKACVKQAAEPWLQGRGKL